jgi:hypothetical protein
MASPGLHSSALRRLSGLPLALWRVLASAELLLGAGALLCLCLLAMAALPALRPGVPQTLAPIATYPAWEALHPGAGWALRALMAALALACLVRLADGLLPMWQASGAAMPVLEVAGDAAEGERLWERVRTSLARQGYLLMSMPGGDEGRCALAVRPLAHRLAAASLYLGLLLLLAAGAALWRQGWVSVSSPLVLGEPVALGPPVALKVELQELQLLHEPEGGLRLAGAIIGLARPEGETSSLALVAGRVTHYAGRWISISKELPAARFAVLDAAQGDLELYPMVGSLPAALVQRVAFRAQEEYLLAAPDANLLIRATYVGDTELSCCLQVQALDGRDGALLGEAFVSEPTDLSIGDVTVRVVPERALILAFWRLPGLWLAALGALLALAGAVAHRSAKPRRMAAGIAHAPELGRWVVFIAAAGRERQSARLAALSAALRSDLEA